MGENVMTKRIIKVIKIASVIGFILIAAFAVYAFILWKAIRDHIWYVYKDGKIWTMSVHWSILTLSMIVISVLVALTSLIVTVRFVRSEKQTHEMYKKPFKLALVCAGAWIVVILIFICTHSGFFKTEDRYRSECFEYSNGQHTIVIADNDVMGDFNKLYHIGISEDIYQINDDNEAVILNGFFVTQKPNSSDDYEIKWYDDKVEVTFEDGLNGKKQTVTAKFK